MMAICTSRQNSNSKHEKQTLRLLRLQGFFLNMVLSGMGISLCKPHVILANKNIHYRHIPIVFALDLSSGHRKFDDKLLITRTILMKDGGTC